MELGIKKTLLPLLMLTALAIGCEQPAKPGVLSGTIADIGWQDFRHSDCALVFILKDDGTTTRVSVYGWPPAWKGMHGQFMFTGNDSCGYEFVSAKEIKVSQ